MERREPYDPEDIEQLLFERPFDALLEEERAFVLRHLNGRAEYESMRALLLRVHADEVPPSMDADPHVREHLLAAFRAEQRPQWRIWLNSLGGLLWPRDASAMWRPALALASVAALVGVSLVVYRGLSSEAHTTLAEVRPDQPVPAAPAPSAATAEEPLTPTPEEAPRTLAEISTQSAEAEATPVAHTDDHLAEPLPVIEEDLAKSTEATDLDLRTVTGSSSKMYAAGASVADSAPAVPSSHTVTFDELAANQSMANATGRVQTTAAPAKETYERDERTRKDAKAKKPMDVSNATEDDGALVGLLRAAW